MFKTVEDFEKARQRSKQRIDGYRAQIAAKEAEIEAKKVEINRIMSSPADDASIQQIFALKRACNDLGEEVQTYEALIANGNFDAYTDSDIASAYNAELDDYIKVFDKDMQDLAKARHALYKAYISAARHRAEMLETREAYKAYLHNQAEPYAGAACYGAGMQDLPAFPAVELYANVLEAELHEGERQALTDIWYGRPRKL